ncbi:MAG: tetratricopeptide repeat protein [Alkalinema sp. RU_4_3]|nr:tetratricopeptide repeat protein [Alkalinema sp. RU_4_3]
MSIVEQKSGGKPSVVGPVVRCLPPLVWSACLGFALVAVPLAWDMAVPAAAQAQESVPEPVRRGYAQLSQGLVDQAIASFKQALDQYPNSLEAKLGLAIGYRRSGKDAEAWQAYQQVLAQDSQNALALRAIGTLGGYKTEWQAKGIEALTRLLSQDGNDREARTQRALLYGYQGRFPESLGDYEILLKGANPSPDVLLGAAQIYTYSSNPTKGLELFDRYRAMTGKPISGNASIAYARALRESGNAAQAVKFLEEMLPKQTGDGTIQVRSELAQAYLANRQGAMALGVLDPLRGRKEARLPLARALNEIGRQENRVDLRMEAASLYQQALQDTPTPTFSLVREVADVLGSIPGQQQVALDLYRQLVAKEPTNRPLIIQQLALESQLGTMAQGEVQQRLRSVLEPLPTDPTQLFAIAQALSRLEPSPELQPVYETLLRAGVNEPFLNFRLAQILIEREDYANAQNALAVYRATPAGAKDLAPELLLAEIDRRQGNYEVAGQRYQALLSQAVDPDIAASALRGLASVRLAQNRSGEALAIYDQLLQRNPNDWQLRLGRTTIAYQAKLISEDEADLVLNQFLQVRPTETPQEFYTLVTILPPSARREPLYVGLLQADPSNLDLQVRLIQVLASRSPLQAQAQANRLLAQIQRMNNGSEASNLRTLLVRGRLAQALGNLEQAGDAYQGILSLQPDNLDAASVLGGIRFQQRKFDSAAQLYAYVLAYQPDNGSVQRSLAELTIAQGKPLEALERFEFLKVQQGAQGSDVETTRRVQQIQEEFLQRRGFQPPWERY